MEPWDEKQMKYGHMNDAIAQPQGTELFPMKKKSYFGVKNIIVFTSQMEEPKSSRLGKIHFGGLLANEVGKKIRVNKEKLVFAILRNQRKLRN